MLVISNKSNDDGTVTFDSTDGSSLVMRIEDGKAEVTELNACDDDVYDGLVKTAAAFAVRRGFEFNREGITWKPNNCRHSS